MRVTVAGPNGSKNQRVEIIVADVAYELSEDRGELLVRRVPRSEAPGFSIAVTPHSANTISIAGGR